MPAQYPSAAGTDANLFIAVNNLATSLYLDHNISTTTIVTLAPTTGFPTAGYITIDAEAISYTGVTAYSFTGCTRGADGTAAATHLNAAQVLHTVVAAHHNTLKDEIIAIATDLRASFIETSTSIATTFGKYLLKSGGTLTGNLAFSPSTAGITGTATNNNAVAGVVGEYVESVVGSGSVGTTAQYYDITSISLTAGDWDVTGIVMYLRNGASWTGIELGISQTTGNSGTGLVAGSNAVYSYPAAASTVYNYVTLSIPSFRILLSGNSTVYLKGYAEYTAATPIRYGRLSARRVR